ncbi:MAG: Maf family protein [candidate division WOR-3 bacterium]|nr:Maf family protein [candidate division WOR-3 bacterium]
MRTRRIILASSSPRRKRLLAMLGVKFSVLAPNIKEDTLHLSPERLATTLAEKKVYSVAGKIKNGIIIGVDTIVAINNKILGKPQSKKDARKMLKLLSNKTHRVISGLVILALPENKVLKTHEITKVTFRKLSSQEIENYLKTNEPYDKAGAYGIQGIGGQFVKQIDGCYYNVVGLPITKLIRALKKFGVRIGT